MEHTYHVPGERASLFIIGIPFTVFGGLFAVIGVLCALGNQTSSGNSFGRILTGVMFAAVGSTAAFIGWEHLFKRPWLIMTLADGTIEFRRAVRSTWLRAGTITALEKRGRQEDSEGQDSRVLMLRYPGGSIPISYFDEVEALIADIHSRNPAVRVHGRWQHNGKS